MEYETESSPIHSIWTLRILLLLGVMAGFVGLPGLLSPIIVVIGVLLWRSIDRYVGVSSALWVPLVAVGTVWVATSIAAMMFLFALMHNPSEGKGREAVDSGRLQGVALEQVEAEFGESFEWTNYTPSPWDVGISLGPYGMGIDDVYLILDLDDDQRVIEASLHYG